ncbi:MAG: hypothetical protein ISS15_01765 [Alphaproteobacteria bacterium]|nr:hypothetical protein [Alphaproteobacteria bacterium]MBL7096359.1 hypothetical protein [Alphaproteobacteria bacterium]
MSFGDPLVGQIAAFLRSIGIEVRGGTVTGDTTLPGIDIDHGALIVDEERLLYPGDLLHEAGHLAVAPPQTRAALVHDVGKDGAEEMMAIAWSYAAALHLKIDPAIVFHEHGYRGGSQSILDAMPNEGIGVPMLQWLGMTFDRKRAPDAGVPPFPHMVRWLREA